MSDTGTPTPANDDKLDKAIQRYEDALQGHKHLTEEQLHKLRQEIQDSMAEARRADAEDREQLKAQLKEVNDFITQEKKAREERDKVKGSSSTMVVPPDDITPPPPPADDPAASEPEHTHRRGWKRYW